MLEWLAASYAALTPRLADAVWQLWEECLNAWPPGTTYPQNRSETWEAMTLNIVAITAPHEAELVFALGDNIWPDGLFTVGVDASGVRALYVDD